MPLHKDLPDSELHEVKGAVGALAGTVLAANGSGSASFVSPSSLTNIVLSSTLTNQSSTSLNPSVLDTPVQVTFDGNQSNSDINISSVGTITFLTTGVYSGQFTFNVGRSTGAGTAVLAIRFLLNGVQAGYPQAVSMADATSARPTQFNILSKFTAGDVLRIEIMRDSAGINQGGLIATNITPSSWADVPACFVRLSKLVGAN